MKLWLKIKGSNVLSFDYTYFISEDYIVKIPNKHGFQIIVLMVLEIIDLCFEQIHTEVIERPLFIYDKEKKTER